MNNQSPVMQNPRMREFSMFFQATLSVLGVIAIVLMNMIIDKMDTYSEEQHRISITLAEFMASTNKDIATLTKNQELTGSILRKQTPVFDRAERYFNKIDRKD